MECYTNEELNLRVLQTIEYYVYKDLEITCDLSSSPVSRINQKRSPEILHFYYFHYFLIFLLFSYFEVSYILKLKGLNIFITIGIILIFIIYTQHIYIYIHIYLYIYMKIYIYISKLCQKPKFEATCEFTILTKQLL